jgi:hypothetical protein
MAPLRIISLLLPWICFPTDSISQVDSLFFKPDSNTIELAEVVILSKATGNSNEEWAFEKLKKKVIKVYPYALMGKEIYLDLNEAKDQAEKKKTYKKYKRNLVKDLKEEFSQELKNLTVSEGKILVKLINRETENNCYAIIKDVKGAVVAFTWQQVAKKYGYDLKEPYDPTSPENSDLEEILKSLESLSKVYASKPEK